MTRRSDIDWSAIEADYRIGMLTIRMLATKYGVAASSITRRAARMAWRRGELAVWVRRLAAAKLRNDPVAERRVIEEFARYEERAAYRRGEAIDPL